MNKEDVRIIKALFNGTHLNKDELERAEKLVCLMHEERNRRLK